MKAIGVVVMTQSAITFSFIGIPVKLTMWYWMGGHAVYAIKKNKIENQNFSSPMTSHIIALSCFMTTYLKGF